MTCLFTQFFHRSRFLYGCRQVTLLHMFHSVVLVMLDFSRPLVLQNHLRDKRKFFNSKSVCINATYSLRSRHGAQIWCRKNHSRAPSWPSSLALLRANSRLGIRQPTIFRLPRPSSALPLQMLPLLMASTGLRSYLVSKASCTDRRRRHTDRRSSTTDAIVHGTTHFRPMRCCRSAPATGPLCIFPGRPHYSPKGTYAGTCIHPRLDTLSNGKSHVSLASRGHIDPHTQSGKSHSLAFASS